MSFTSLTFLLFLIAVFALYWGFPRRRLQNALIVVASFFFYSWWDYRFSGLMLAAALIDFFGGLAIHASERPTVRRAWLTVCLGSNLALLGFFKYFGFFAENLRALSAATPWHFDFVTLNIVLPVGISFYTFQSMSYSIDVYRRQMKPSRNIIDYLAFVTYFPQLVAGPIERATCLLPQIESDRRFDHADAVDGCRQVLWGFFKKMVLADGLSVIVDRCYGNWETASGPVLAFATVCFAFQIYCDFSAYSDIAIGVSRLFGIRLMRNFAYPYFSQDIVEFWRRWHISLSTWFRDYVYIPLGGSRAGRWPRLRNVLVTFLVSGFWHGASWNFIAWGGLHGMAMALGMRRAAATPIRAGDTPAAGGWLPSLRALRGILATFVLVCVGWVFFRAATLGQALSILGRVARDMFDGAAYRSLAELFRQDRHCGTLLLILAAFVVAEWLQRAHSHPLHLPRWPGWARWATYTFLLWFTLFHQAATPSPFIYFQF